MKLIKPGRSMYKESHKMEKMADLAQTLKSCKLKKIVTLLEHKAM